MNLEVLNLRKLEILLADWYLELSKSLKESMEGFLITHGYVCPGGYYKCSVFLPALFNLKVLSWRCICDLYIEEKRQTDIK